MVYYVRWGRLSQSARHWEKKRKMLRFFRSGYYGMLYLFSGFSVGADLLSSYSWNAQVVYLTLFCLLRRRYYLVLSYLILLYFISSYLMDLDGSELSAYFSGFSDVVTWPSHLHYSVHTEHLLLLESAFWNLFSPSYISVNRYCPRHDCRATLGWLF